MALADSFTGASGCLVLIEQPAVQSHASEEEEEEDGEVLEEEPQSTNDSCAELPFLHGAVVNKSHSPVPTAPPPPAQDFSSFLVAHHISNISLPGVPGFPSNNANIPPPPPTPPPAAVCNVTNVGRPRPALIFHSGNTLLPPPPPPPPLEVEEGEAAEESVTLNGPDTFGRGLLGSNPTLITAITNAHRSASLPSIYPSAGGQVHGSGGMIGLEVDHHHRHQFLRQKAVPVLPPRTVQPAMASTVVYQHHPKPPPLPAINGVSLHTHTSANDRNPQYTSVVHKRLKQSGQSFPGASQFRDVGTPPNLEAIAPRQPAPTKSAIATAIAQCSNGEALNRKLNGGESVSKRNQPSLKPGVRIIRQLSHQTCVARDVTSSNELGHPVQVGAVNNHQSDQPDPPKVRKVEEDSKVLAIERIPKKARSINVLALSVPVSGEEARSPCTRLPPIEQPRLKLRTKPICSESGRDSHPTLPSVKLAKSSTALNGGVLLDDVLLPDLESPARPTSDAPKKKVIYSERPSSSEERADGSSSKEPITDGSSSKGIVTDDPSSKSSVVVPKHCGQLPNHPRARPRERPKCTTYSGKSTCNTEALEELSSGPSSHHKKETKPRGVESVSSGEKPDHSTNETTTSNIVIPAERESKTPSLLLTPTLPLPFAVDAAETTASTLSQERGALTSAKTEAATPDGIGVLPPPRKKISQQAPRKRKRQRSDPEKLQEETSPTILLPEVAKLNSSEPTTKTDLTNSLVKTEASAAAAVSEAEQRPRTPLLESPISIESSAETFQCQRSRPGSPHTGAPPRLVWPVTRGTLVLNWRQSCHQPHEGTESCSTTTARSLDDRSELAPTCPSESICGMEEGRFAAAPFVVSAKPLEWALGLAVKKRAVSSEHLFSFGQKLSEKLTSCQKHTDSANSSACSAFVSQAAVQSSLSPPVTPPPSTRATTFAAGQQVLMTAAAAVRDDFSRRRCVSWISPTCMITGEGGLGLAEWIEQSAGPGGGEEEGSEDEGWGSMVRKRKQILTDLLIKRPPVEEDEDDDMVSEAHSSFAALSSDEEPPVQIPCFIDVDEEQDRNTVTSALLHCFNSSSDDDYNSLFCNCPRMQREVPVSVKKSL